MITEQQIEDLILATLNTINDSFSDDAKIQVSSKTILFGSDSEIDSLALVSLVVDLEAALSEDYEDISLTDDRAMTREKSPFTSVASLKEYIFELLSERKMIADTQ
jgi:acyl carrier protein